MPNAILQETGDDILLEDGSGVLLKDNSVYADLVRADAPIGWWRLGEASGTTAKDEIGGRDATYVNSPTLGVTGPLYDESNTAVTFVAASTTYATVPVDTIWNIATTSQLSVELWFRFTSYVATGEIVSYRTSTDGWDVSSNSSGQIQIGAETGNVSVDGFGVVTGVLAIGAWTHIVATWNDTADETRLYANGIQVASRLSWAAAAPTQATNPLTFGKDSITANSAYDDATMDEIAIYNYVLTPAQVSAHFLAGVPRHQRDVRVTGQSMRRAATI